MYEYALGSINLELKPEVKVSKVAKIRNRYNQVPHLTQDTKVECEGRVEKSVPRIAVWHLEACRVMTNGDPQGQIFSILLSHEYWILFLAHRCFFFY